MRPYGKEKR
ncbi:hypothetical protein TIFTF001_056467 [Ficus carica]|uniref:Uncharacterized protein n=1 Tax=Ficus carica TaxID=3494 RepID=A0AA88JFY7_FICCA|nr:hypothetical protein TIFTF001_056467 [Ficus carica]